MLFRTLMVMLAITSIPLRAPLRAEERTEKCGVALQLELKRLIRESISHPARPENVLSTIAIQGSLTGEHGGRRYLLKRVGAHWDSSYEHFPAAKQGSPTWAIEVLGEELAAFLGYVKISDEYMTAPDAIDLNAAIEILDQELRLAGKPPLRMRFQLEKGRLSEREYFNQVKDRIAPYGDSGNMLLHDASYHGPSIGLPELFYEHFETQAQYWEKFEAFVRKHLPNPKLEEVLARDTSGLPVEDTGHPFFSQGTRKLNRQFDQGTGNLVADLAKIRKSGTRYLSAEWFEATFGRLTAQGLSPQQWLLKLVQEQMVIDLGANSSLMKIFEEFNAAHRDEPAYTSSLKRELNPEKAIQATLERIKELDDARRAYEKRPALTRLSTDARRPWITTKEAFSPFYAGEKVLWRNGARDEKVLIQKWRTTENIAVIERPIYWHKVLSELPEGTFLRVKSPVSPGSPGIEPSQKLSEIPSGSTVEVISKDGGKPLRTFLPKQPATPLYSHYEVLSISGNALMEFPDRHPQAKEFAKQYPHPIADLASPQTRVKYHGRDYLVESYNESTGRVTLSRDEIVTYDLAGRSKDKLKPGMREHRPELKLEEYGVGDIVAIDGLTYQVLHTAASHGDHVTLARRERVIIPWKKFSSLAESPQLVTSQPWTSKPLPHQLGKSDWTSLALPRRKIAPLLGHSRVKRLSMAEGNAPFPKWKGTNAPPVPALVIRYELGTAPKTSVIEVKIPADNAPKRLRQIEKLLAAIPLHLEDLHQELRVNEGPKQGSPSANASTTAPNHANKLAVIDLYKPGMEVKFSKLREGYWHELGHQLGARIFGSTMPEQQWIRAIIEDRGAFVRSYSAAAPSEDFADSVRTYLETDGGRLDPKVRKEFPNRFKLLDRIFAVPTVQAELSAATQETAARYRMIVLVGMGVAAAAGGGYYALVPQGEDDHATK